MKTECRCPTNSS